MKDVAPAEIPQAWRRCVEDARAGYRLREIAERQGLQPGTVQKYLSFARAAGEAVPELSRAPYGEAGWGCALDLRIELDAWAVETLDAEARRLGLSRRRLVRRLLEAICEDGMVDAVLDTDGGGS